MVWRTMAAQVLSKVARRCLAGRINLRSQPCTHAHLPASRAPLVHVVRRAPASVPSDPSHIVAVNPPTYLPRLYITCLSMFW
jgi:hypothetical protein